MCFLAIFHMYIVFHNFKKQKWADENLQMVTDELINTSEDSEENFLIF